MGSPSSRRQQRGRAQKRAERRRRTRGARRLGLAGTQLRRLAGMPKMSDTLLEFAGPFLEMTVDPSDLGSVRTGLSFAALVWNGLALLEKDHEEAEAFGVETLERAHAALVDLGMSDDEAAELIALLDERKQTLFPDEDRLVVSVDAERRGGRLHILAASTFE